MISSESLRPTLTPGRKPLGKLATRLEEAKNPWRQVSTLELSHNEVARLATDALLEMGEKEYRRVLTEERELSFLSPLEIQYITDNATKNSVSDSNSSNGSEREFAEADTVSELTSGTYFPMMSDEEPPVLELGWPELPLRYGPSETQIYFQRDKSHNLKDLIRSLINKAKKVIAIVMDLFTDVDLLCDLMEASNKRKVPVYILLDSKNLTYFIDMCKALDIHSSHLSNMRIRSVCGETYCTKLGKKFTGQVQEKFMIIDCEEVIAGSYSFSWLSAQVHTNMLLHFSGRIAESFDREFRCLYADSQIIDYFHNPDEEGLPYYPIYPYMFGQKGKDLTQERVCTREKLCSENSSSQSSSSLSSVKKAPGKPATVYQVSHDKRDTNSPYNSPERRGGQTPPGHNQERRGSQTQLSHNHGGHIVRGSPNANGHSSSMERLTPVAGQSGIEWAKAPETPDYLRSNLGGTTSKMQALGLYDHKQTAFHGTPKATSPPMDSKITGKNRNPSNPLLNKISDMFQPSSKERDIFNFRRSPPESAAFGGPDLSQAEPESKQPLPLPPPLSPDRMPMNRHDAKRMTLGHSKLDLVNHYNKLKSKNIYSRFELKNNN
ncbi:hypothetical protein JZ751_018010 [Albula glossodonta]|uniref:Scaffolding anchor of CK1 domain-containing protein n=1 Tax=Albula glossodonta TaxID=121402 RepID=A0A8T2PPY2_9TELE|nr:hypothetical protein JZ751_018010 [Albula glossodonta]